MTVPPEAINAAADAITTSPLLSGYQVTGWSKTVVTVALEAAAPLITSEREQGLREAMARFENLEAAAMTAAVEHARTAERDRLESRITELENALHACDPYHPLLDGDQA